MIEPRFIDEENVPLIADDDYEEETSFTFPPSSDGHLEPSFATPQSNYNFRAPLQQLEIKRQKISSLYKHLGHPRLDPNLADLDKFRMRKNEKSGKIMVEFYKDGGWVKLTKDNGDFYATSTLLNKIGVNLFHALNLEETPSKWKKAAHKLQDVTDLDMEEISLQDLVPKVDVIETELRKSSQDLPMRELLGLDKALTRIKGELANNISKLGELDTHIKHEDQKLKDMLNDSSYSDEQRREVRNRLSDLKEEQKARLELVTQNRKNLQSNIARIKQTVEKVLDSDSSLAEKIRTIFREQGLTIGAILTAFGLLISTIVTALTGGEGRGGGGLKPPSKTDDVKKWIQNKLKALARLLGKLAEKAAAALPGIIGSIVSWLLNTLQKVVSFALEHVWAFIVFVVGLVFTTITKKSHLKK